MTQTNSLKGITVSGFKSICKAQHIILRPLTILAGANSSGKSSIMQPLLLLKQTIEAPGDPGALLLDGPNARFTSSDQLLCKAMEDAAKGSFTIRLELDNEVSIETIYRVLPGQGFTIEKMDYSAQHNKMTLLPDMSDADIQKILPKQVRNLAKEFASKGQESVSWRVFRERCFLAFDLVSPRGPQIPQMFWPIFGLAPSMEFLEIIQAVIHLPGLRGNPRRTYPKTAAGPRFAGTFESYAASLIYQWQQKKRDRLEELSKGLEVLGLSWKVFAKPVDDTQVELQVGRLPRSKQGGARDLVSIADVGFGVSQCLPVLVALIAANPGQIVYLEQPEIHLHPRAQRKLAGLLANAARRGVVLVVETHSAILLREIQTLVASDQLPKESVILHWFQRDHRTGLTSVTTADLDDAGAYGNWPADFDETELDAEQAYLDAAERKGTAG